MIRQYLIEEKIRKNYYEFLTILDMPRHRMVHVADVDMKVITNYFSIMRHILKQNHLASIKTL